MQEKEQMDGLRAENRTVGGLAVPKLSMDRRLNRGHYGRNHGSRVEHTTGYGILDPG